MRRGRIEIGSGKLGDLLHGAAKDLRRVPPIAFATLYETLPQPHRWFQKYVSFIVEVVLPMFFCAQNDLRNRFQ